jgi:hypothetical protein
MPLLAMGLGTALMPRKRGFIALMGRRLRMDIHAAKDKPKPNPQPR